MLFLLVLLVAAGLVACDTGGTTPTPPAVAAGPVPASSADVRLVRAALDGVQTLSRFHYRLDSVSEGVTDTGTLEGDFIAPDQMHEYASNNSGYQAEQLYLGNRIYQKENGGWVEKPTSTDQTTFIQSYPTLLTTQMYSYTQVLDTAVFDTGHEETIAGTRTHIYSYTVALKAIPLKTSLATPIEPPDMVGRTGNSGSLWIDRATGHLYRLVTHTDLSLMGYVEQLKSMVDLGDTSRLRYAIPTPQPPAIATDTLTLTRLNDPTITMPTLEPATQKKRL